MIISVEDAKQFIKTTESDAVLEAKLQALELTIQRYTNNDFKRFLTDEGEYPADVKMGVVNMLKWELENRDKVGIQSETISRHSVTYFNMDGDNSTMGYPKSLLGFLKPYHRARF
jgi:hypothetical protein